MKLGDLEIYQIARVLSKDIWQIYEKLDWRDKKMIGDQCISAIDSIGANITEGFGRYHYLDKNKFNYNARGSLLESFYWLEVLLERGKIEKEVYVQIKNRLDNLHLKLNSYINSAKSRNTKL